MVMNATIIKAEGATIIMKEAGDLSPVLGQPDLAVHSKDVQAPNRLLESLLLLLGSQRELARFGDINELFDSNRQVRSATSQLAVLGASTKDFVVAACSCRDEVGLHHRRAESVIFSTDVAPDHR